MRCRLELSREEPPDFYIHNMKVLLIAQGQIVKGITRPSTALLKIIFNTEPKSTFSSSATKGQHASAFAGIRELNISIGTSPMKDANVCGCGYWRFFGIGWYGKGEQASLSPAMKAPCLVIIGSHAGLECLHSIFFLGPVASRQSVAPL